MLNPPEDSADSPDASERFAKSNSDCPEKIWLVRGAIYTKTPLAASLTNRVEGNIGRWGVGLASTASKNDGDVVHVVIAAASIAVLEALESSHKISLIWRIKQIRHVLEIVANRQALVDSVRRNGAESFRKLLVRASVKQTRQIFEIARRKRSLNLI